MAAHIGHHERGHSRESAPAHVTRAPHEHQAAHDKHAGHSVAMFRARTPGMMTLIALAISVAFAFSLAVTFGSPGPICGGSSRHW